MGSTLLSSEVELLAAGVDFANTVRDYLARQDYHKSDHKFGDQLSNALRALYFPPSGILSFLKAIQNGEHVAQEGLEKALTNFNDREWTIAAALQALDFGRLQHELNLNLATLAALERVRAGKLNLRQAIQREINFYGQPDARPNRKRVDDLIANIEKLNSAIEQVEAAVNTRARAR